MLFRLGLIVLATALFLLQPAEAQEVVTVIPQVSQNPSELAPPVVTSTISTVSTLKRNDWWPPSAQDVVTQTSPYTTELQHSMPPTYYAPAPSVPHYRSDQWTPYGYPEFGYPVLPPHNNQIAVPTKYMTVALFIGLLTLFAIIQGAMTASKQRESIDSLPAREKRDLLISADFDHMTPEEQDIYNIGARIRCIQRTICLENRQLVRDLGPIGTKLSDYLTGKCTCLPDEALRNR
ncbi:uncharacterized protein LOC135160452 isoform X2 [Diachasmimorpha longicaudata]|uniref:uncharacterized protein LOC135160452 isoform X2 n=1 Tax=Diachasmimorpha longicaudata TaxID=58733 RepID=UPI0030B86C4F